MTPARQSDGIADRRVGESLAPWMQKSIWFCGRPF